MSTIQETKQLIEKLLNFLKTYSALRDGHMVDYFTKSLYDRAIPNDIRDEISKVGYENVVKNILACTDNPLTPKLNLFITTAKNFSLYKTRNICMSFNDFKKKLHDLGRDSEVGVKMGVFMNSKKAHEVEVLSAVAATVSKIVGTSHLVDIGDGKGYLSSLLALHHKIPVLGVDACYVNTTGAVKRASKLEKHWHSVFKISKESEEYKNLINNAMLYKQVTQIVTEDTDFDGLIKNIFLKDCVGIGLVGLHTCGNLGPSSIRIFNANQKIKSICNVSCCYHLLNEKYLPNTSMLMDVEKYGGFPMSAFLSSNNIHLGRAACMLSAQSIDRILANQDLPNKVIFYRAIFEVVLKGHYSAQVTKNVGRFRKEPLNFVEYSRESMRRVGVTIDVTDGELEEYYEKYKVLRVQLNVFHLIRSMLAPVVESLILLDRYLFLLEQGHKNVFLIQLFDPVISPRCYGLVAFKN